MHSVPCTFSLKKLLKNYGVRQFVVTWRIRLDHWHKFTKAVSLVERVPFLSGVLRGVIEQMCTNNSRDNQQRCCCGTPVPVVGTQCTPPCRSSSVLGGSSASRRLHW